MCGFRSRAGAPFNLTHAAHTRDEDPKFSFDGSKIVFKRNGILTEMDTLGGILKSYALPHPEASMPYYSWRVSGNPNDQVYLGFFGDRANTRLPFNESDHDFSDAYPVSGRYLVLSSAKAGGKGAYDLYVADVVSGASWSLSRYKPNLNTARNELGACYREKERQAHRRWFRTCWGFSHRVKNGSFSAGFRLFSVT